MQKFSGDQAVCTLRFNWATVLFYAFFLAYGYFGAITPEFEAFKSNLAGSVGMLIFLASVFAALGFLAWKASDRFEDSVEIHRADIFALLSYFIILFAASFQALQFSLFSDELSYAGTSHAQSIYVSLLLSRYVDALDSVPFQYIVQAISFMLLLSLSALVAIAGRIPWKYKIAVFALLLIAGRLVFSFTNGNSSPHPPLQLIPPFLFGSVLGINDFSFKLSYFTAYIIFIFILYRLMQRVLSRPVAYLFALAVGTIPAIWHLGTVVEHSFWGAVFFTVVLVDLATSRHVNYVRLFSFISIGVLMRQPVFLAFIPVLLMFFFNEIIKKDRSQWLGKLAFAIFGVLLFLPFLGRSLIVGTPSTSALNEGSMLERVLSALNSDIIWVAIANSVTYWWALLIPLAFIPLSRSMFSRNMVFLLFFMAAITVYYSILPSLWGYGKYQAEYAVPFAVVGMLLLVMKMPSAGRSSVKHLPAAVAVVLIVCNTAYYLQLPEINKPVDTLVGSLSVDSKRFDSGYHVLTALPYNYKDAYSAIKQAGLTDRTFSIGATYGILPEIMNGYPASSARTAYDIYRKQQSNMLSAPDKGWDVSLIEADGRIRVVLLGALPKPVKAELVEKFMAHGWSTVGEYRNVEYGSTIIALQR